MNFGDIHAAVATEEAAFEFARTAGTIRLAPRQCSRCSTTMVIERSKMTRGLNHVWRCRNPSCRSSQSVLSCSFFENTRLPVSKAVILLFCFARSMSRKDSALEARVSRQTVITFFKAVRQLIVKHNERNHIFYWRTREDS